MAAVITLTLNPCVDVATSAPHVVPTHKLRCEPPVRTPGGGGVQVARYLHRLGYEVLAMHTAGGHAGAQLQALLDLEGVPHCAVPIAQDTRESWHVLEVSSSREFRFVMPGPELAAHEWQAALDLFAQRIPGLAYAVLSGSLPPGVPVDAYAQLLRICQRHGVRTVVDASGEALRAALQQGVDMVKPSLGELRGFTGLPLSTQEAQVRAIRDLVDQGRARMVVLSLGDQGALLASAQGVWRASAPAVDVVSAVGAGDSMVAGLVSAAMDGMDEAQTLAWASAVSAATISQAPPNPWKKEDPVALQRRVVLQKL